MSSKPNDSGFNLKAANLHEDTDDSPEVPEEPEPEPEPEVYQPPINQDQAIRDHMIASEDRVKRRQLIMTIQGYYRSPRFGTYLQKNGFVEDLATVTLEEMIGLLDDIKVAIQNKNGSQMIQQGVPRFLCACEPMISQWYDVKGMTSRLVRSESFRDLLEEVALENQMFTNVSASRRMCYEIVTAAFYVHGENEHAAQNKIAEKPVQLSDKHSDLVS
jgi:hypothetical protein